MNLHGHYWTISRVVQTLFGEAPAPPSVAWSTELVNPEMGAVRLTGRLSEPSTSAHLVVLVHGLGGSAERAYVRHAARAASDLGIASLRLNLRGADLSGDDIHHAGLIEDLAATLASPALARFEHVTLFGFSLGGHTCLRYAALGPDARVRAVAALCTPVDLASVADAFDAPPFSPYRPYILNSLRRIHDATAARGRSKTPARATLGIKRIRQWDEVVVAPRFGFESADHYYRTMSVAPLLDRLSIPALYVGSDHDPMVPKAVVAPFLRNARALEIHWLARGGHIGFPADATFGTEVQGQAGQSGAAGIDREIVSWLCRHAGF